MKTCTKCGDSKALDGFYKHKLASNGIVSVCKVCAATYRAARYAINKVKINKQNALYYLRNKAACNLKSAEHYSLHKTEKATRAKTYLHDNPDKKAAKMAAAASYYAANRGAMDAVNSAWRAANRSLSNSYGSKWRAANPEKKKAKAARHRARKLQAVPGWFDSASVSLVYAKARVWSKILVADIEVDHVVPLKSPIVCGLHCHANLQLLDQPLNGSKGNYRWPDMP